MRTRDKKRIEKIFGSKEADRIFRCVDRIPTEHKDDCKYMIRVTKGKDYVGRYFFNMPSTLKCIISAYEGLCYELFAARELIGSGVVNEAIVKDIRNHEKNSECCCVCYSCFFRVDNGTEYYDCSRGLTGYWEENGMYGEARKF